MFSQKTILEIYKNIFGWKRTKLKQRRQVIQIQDIPFSDLIYLLYGEDMQITLTKKQLRGRKLGDMFEYFPSKFVKNIAKRYGITVARTKWETIENIEDQRSKLPKDFIINIAI